VTLRVVAAVIAINVFLLAISEHSVISPRCMLGSVMLWVSAYPLWRYFARSETGIPYIPTFGAIYFMYYGLPAFTRLLRVRGYSINDEIAQTTLFLAVAGEILLLATFYLSYAMKAPFRVRLSLDLSGRAWRLLATATLFVGLRFMIMQSAVPMQLASVSNFVVFLPVVLLGALLLCHLQGSLPASARIVAVGLLVVTLLLDLATGAVAQPALTAATLLFVYVAHQRRVPVLMLVLCVALLVPSLGTKLEYREQVRRDPSMSTGERIGLFLEMIGGTIMGQGKKNLRDAGQVAEERVDHLSAFAYVITKTPDSVPYWDGATYEGFFWSFVPRVLYLDKPQKTLGQQYGHRYGFIGAANWTTSINLEQTVEMYANYGVAGVLLGMCLMGLLYRLLYQILNHEHRGEGGELIAAATFRVLLNIESDFSLVFGGIVQNAMLLYVVLWFLARRRGPAASPAIAG
jgi:hypothetical protein